jgi:hypothetical protein
VESKEAPVVSTEKIKEVLKEHIQKVVLPRQNGVSVGLDTATMLNDKG